MSLIQNLSFANPTSPVFGPAPAYGSFSSSLTQAVNTVLPLPATFTTVDIVPVGVSLAPGGTGGVRIGVSGVYKCLASVQCDRTAGGVGEIDMFVGGVLSNSGIPNTGTRVQVSQNQEQVMTVEWLLPFNAGDILNVFFFSSSAGQQLLAVPIVGLVPAIPSIILTLVKIA